VTKTITLVICFDQNLKICLVLGIVNSFVQVQVVVWWLEHVLILFWRVKFPFKANLGSASKKKACQIHFFFIAVGFLAPLVPVLTSVFQAIAEYSQKNQSPGLVSSRFGYQLTFQRYCAQSNFRVLFYSFAMYLAIIQGVGTTFMVLIFYLLCNCVIVGYICKKVHNLKKNINIITPTLCILGNLIAIHNSFISLYHCQFLQFFLL